MSPSLRSHPLAIAESQETYADAMAEPSPAGEYEELIERDRDMSSPLLLEPPRSRSGEFRHRMALVAIWLSDILGLERDFLNHVLRMVFFIAKLMSLAQSCWPYMAKFEVGVPLIIIAALDLKVPEPTISSLARCNRRGEIEFGPSRLRGLGWSVALLVFHTIVIWLAQRWGALCLKPPQEKLGPW